FLAAGCDAVETNTFGGSGIALGEFHKEAHTEEINRIAARLAWEAVKEFSTPAWPRFVVGSVGPGTKPVSFTDNTITFDQVADAYRPQMRGLLEEGVDVLCLETSFDILHLKALVVTAREEMKRLGLLVPLMAQVTIEAFGTMLAGTDIASALITLEALPIDII